MRSHVVMFSGGIGSWATATRVAAKHGTGNLVLLFADTKVEDDDTYRFLHEAAGQVGGQLVTVADGRTPFEVFDDLLFIGNNRVARCSELLKTKPCMAWVEATFDPDSTTLYVGIDWSETHRIPSIERMWAPYEVAAPMCDEPYIAKGQMIADARKVGLEPPQAYAEGFPHANCGAQGCVRGGQAYWEMLLRRRPDVYRATEDAEAALAAKIKTERGYATSILRDRTGGTTDPLTLREFRQRIETQPALFDEFEWGGCGCFTEEDA